MHFVMYAYSNHVGVLHHVMPIDFDISTVFNEHNIQILYEVMPLDLLAQAAGSLGSIGGSI